jgi:cytochrome c
MRIVVSCLTICLLVAAMACPLMAGKAEDAENMVEQALTMIREKGTDAAFKTINDKNGPFVKGDMYVFALTIDNVVMAHPYEHAVRRVSVNNINDAAGMPLFQKMKEIVETKGSGWIDYMWTKPGENRPSPKRTFVKKVPEKPLYIGVGYYLEQQASGK